MYITSVFIAEIGIIKPKSDIGLVYNIQTHNDARQVGLFVCLFDCGLTQYLRLFHSQDGVPSTSLATNKDKTGQTQDKNSKSTRALRSSLPTQTS